MRVVVQAGQQKGNCRTYSEWPNSATAVLACSTAMLQRVGLANRTAAIETLSERRDTPS